MDVRKHPEAVIPWAKENHDELRKCAKQARKHRIVATGDIGRLSPGDRLAVFNELMNEEYVKVGKVHVAVAKAVEFLHRDDKAIRELLGLSELADIGYEAFLFRERFAHHATGFVKNPDGSVGARFVDVKNAQTLNSIQTAISKSVLQGEGAVIIYNGLETFSRVLEEITGRLEENVQQGQHFVFAKMQRSKEVGFEWLINTIAASLLTPLRGGRVLTNFPRGCPFHQII